MNLLYLLHDQENENAFDHLSLSEQTLWDLVVDEKPKNFSEFLNELWASEIDFDRSYLGELEEGLHLSCHGLNFIGGTSSLDPLSVSWANLGNEETTEDDLHNAYLNSKFEVRAMDASGKLILSKELLSGIRLARSYAFSSSEWAKILQAPGNTYSIAIACYATRGYETGPFMTGTRSFEKPL